MAQLLRSLLSRRRTDNHNVVGIQGEPGSGKSTLALSLALNIDPTFGVENVHYNRKAWQEIAQAEKGGVFILDEGANVAMSRTWMQKGQVALMQLLNMIRQRNHTLIWCTPNLERLDVVVREDLLTHKVNVTRRGFARVRTRYLDRDGEPAGWKTWPVPVSWDPLEKHPIWAPYVAAKDANFAGKTVEMSTNGSTSKHKGRTRDELALIRPRYRDAKGRITNKPPDQFTTATVD